MNIVKEKSKTEMIADIIHEQIAQGDIKPDTKLGSIRSLASKFSVSNKVIELAFNILEERKQIYKKPRSGVYIRKTRQKRESGIIGLITPFKNEYFEELFEVAIRIFDKKKVLCVPCKWDENSNGSQFMLPKLLKQKPKGLIIYMPTCNPVDKLLKTIGDIPRCFIEYRLEENCRPAVFFNYVEAFQKALTFLFAKGHKRIMIVGYKERIGRNFDALQEACENIGKKFPSDEIIYAASSYFDGKNNERIKEIFNSSVKPSAIFSFSDFTCWQFLKHIEKFYPEFVFSDIVGFFNTKWSQQRGHEFHSLAPDYENIIDQAINKIVNFDLDDQKISWVESKLIIRNTSK